MSDLSDYYSYSLVLVAYCMFFLWMVFVLWRKRAILHCEDLLTGRSGKVSRIAIAQLSGILIASWVPIHLALNGGTDSTVLGVCLGYLAAVEGFSKWLASREGTTTTSSSTTSSSTVSPTKEAEK